MPNENLLLGFNTSDDAAVYRINNDVAAVLTLDFFTPVVDDPYEFGAIAAANALSDIFAMGAKPLAALNILAFPCNLGAETVAEVLRGGADKVHEAGGCIAGGHSIDDKEPKYGLSVFGCVRPDEIIYNNGAQLDDVLFYTKPIGSGIMNSAFRAGFEDDLSMRPVIQSMMELNGAACTAMKQAKAHAATDVTGFGLAGHLHEMLAASHMAAELVWNDLPLFEKVYTYSCDFCRPAKTFSIIEWAQSFVEQGNLTDKDYNNRMGVLCDPQTSGGLLVAVAKSKAEVFSHTFKSITGRNPFCIGRIIEGEAGTIYLR